MSEDTSRSVDSAVFASSPRAFFARIASSDHPSLSYSEEFLWWSARLAGDATFNVRVVLRLRGPLRLGALEDSIVEVARRHETLRTVFPMENGVILRRILPPGSTRPTVIDLEPLDAVNRETESWRLGLDEANRPFNLARGPLFRSSILRVGADDHLLQFTIHHLVIDARSVDILLRELGTLYGAYCRNSESPLPELPIQYAEYAAQRRRSLQGGTLDRALSYWKAQLAGIPSLLDLPTDGPRRAARRYRGRTITFALSAGDTNAIRRLARQHRTTVFVVLLAILKILLYRLSGNRCIVVETPLGNRRSTEAEGLIGLLVDLVALRTDLAANPSLPDLLASVRRATLGAFDHAGVPFHVLVNALNASVDASHSALCQVMFNLINMQQRALHLESLDTEQLPLPDSPHSKFDLMLTAHLRDALQFQLLYRCDLFSDLRMQELVEQFRTLVDQVLTAPDRRVDQYSLVTPRAERALPRFGARTGVACRCAIQARVGSHAQADPGRAALVDGHREVSYRELDSRSNQLARDLVAHGVRQGDVVAVARDSAITLVGGLLGIVKAGAACLIVDSIDGVDLANDCGVHVKAIVKAGPESAASIDPGPANGQGGVPTVVLRAADHPVGADSGSHPTVIPGSHQALSSCAQWTTDTFSIPPGALVGALPCVNTNVLIQAIFTALWSGGTMCFQPPSGETPDDLHHWLNRGITVAYGEPTAWRRLRKNGRALPSLRCAFFVGDALVREDVGRVRALAPGATCAYFFGPGKPAQRYSCYTVPADTSELRAIVPVGRGISDVELVILNRDRQLAGIGELGRLYLRGGHSVESSACNGDGLVATEFMGRLLPGGDVDCIGDSSHWGSIDGYTVRLDEIASALMRHPDVLDAKVVFGANGADVELVAYVTSDGERAWPGEDLDGFVRNHLPAYMVPRRFVRVPCRGPGDAVAALLL